MSAPQDQGFNLGDNMMVVVLAIAAVIVVIAIILVYFKL